MIICVIRPSFSSDATLSAVPGEPLGLYEAWKKFGRLPWKQLLQPAIDMCRYGFKLPADITKFIPGSFNGEDPLWR